MKGQAARPLVTLIAAVAEDGFISRGTGVPWDIPADREHFRRFTEDKWLLLGRRTFEEMLGWFRGRFPLVLSRDPAFKPAEGRRVSHVSEAIALANQAGQAEIVVCGGAAAYAAAMPFAVQLIITRVHERLGGGAAFPMIDPGIWRLEKSNPLPCPVQSLRPVVEVYRRPADTLVKLFPKPSCRITPRSDNPPTSCPAPPFPIFPAKSRTPASGGSSSAMWTEQAGIHPSSAI